MFMRRAAYAIGIAGLLLCSCGRESPPPPPPLKVIVEAVQPADFASTVSLTGDVAARVTSELSFRVGGQILERKAEVGDHVTAGQVLATLDPQEQQANLVAAQAGIEASQAQLRQAASTFERQKELIGSGFTTRRDYDQAEAALRSAQGSLESAKAQLGTAQDQLDQTTLRAGVAGVLTARKAEAGEVVQAAQTVYSLAQDGPRDAVFNVYESIFVRERTGDTIRVALLGNPAIEREAHVREISPAVDTSSGTVRVKFEIIDPAPEMTLGASVIGSGRFKSRHMIALAWTALSADSGKPAVWVVDPASKAVSLHTIEIESYELGRILVRQGLEPGQLVVSRGQQLLRPAQVVDPVQAPRT